MVISGRGIRNAFQREEEVVIGLNLGPGWGSARGTGRREGGSQLREQTDKGLGPKCRVCLQLWTRGNTAACWRAVGEKGKWKMLEKSNAKVKVKVNP